MGQYFMELLFFFIGMGLYCMPRIWSAEVTKPGKILVIGFSLYGILLLALSRQWWVRGSFA
jgi:hypothetical protein